MDKHDIMRKARAARQFSVEVAPGVSITLQLPTRQEVAIAAARAGLHKEGAQAEGLVRVQRDLLQAAVVGWGVGVTLQHVLPDEPAESLPFDADMVPLLLDAQPAWEQVLLQRFVAEREARAAMLEAAQGNSPGASSGSVPPPMRPTPPMETRGLPSSLPASSGPH